MIVPSHAEEVAYTDPDRRDFVKSMCVMAAAAVGLPATAADAFAQAVARKRPPVIWLSGQECTGCTESLLRTSHPGLGTLVLDLISLDYHEALSAAAGHQAEEAKRASMEENAGQYVLVIEGAIPTKDGGIYCKIAGQTMVDAVHEAAENAGAIIAIGSCASWGGIPSADPNPTGATGAPGVLQDYTVVTIPGCPANPYNFLGTVLQYATFGTLPALDELGRPVFAYGRTIHEDCPRRAHFDAGRFVETFGDEGHQQGWCLYKMGCKGPETYNNCSTQGFGEVGGAWPVGTGHPCFGCSEYGVAFNKPLFETAEVLRLTPSASFPEIHPEQGPAISPWATGIAGAVGGLAIGGAAMASRQLGQYDPKMEEVKPESGSGSGGGEEA
ncbi:MAG: hydrogenase small subunit [Longimicrobiales bacterium]|nr:hydrogenase small subunit [Longimicrobiales bacterium]